jgi:hypothetical protein
MKNKFNTQSVTPKSKPQYALRKIGNIWELTFEGSTAKCKDEAGWKYVHYLLFNPPNEPIFGYHLAARVAEPGATGAALTEIVHPYTGEIVPIPKDATIQERNLGLDDAEAMRFVLKKQNELESLLEDPELIEPIRREVERELVELYDYEKHNSRKLLDPSQRMVRTVRKSIKRLHAHLSTAIDGSGFPNVAARSFAKHLNDYIMIPSSRYSSPACRHTRDDAAGCFTYERPSGVVWKS